jgi:hypothetical protein
MQKLILITVFAIIFAPALADEYEGDFLYRVSTVRAATGSLANGQLGRILRSGGY